MSETVSHGIQTQRARIHVLAEVTAHATVSAYSTCSVRSKRLQLILQPLHPQLSERLLPVQLQLPSTQLPQHILLWLDISPVCAVSMLCSTIKLKAAFNDLKIIFDQLAAAEKAGNLSLQERNRLEEQAAEYTCTLSSFLIRHLISAYPVAASSVV
ncbi:hypothetical protein NEOLEDRAFT_1145422 [Neolentinus lepideus HHB14362 ss-1]|uniref:Uncharacterized protein n=1 Tax=Neolentinus lepideus HHB14362 ss-1 TaxID=1314782 RepID=A0A165V472_9AGAM|nr:hypothetical protein NEOLEDRAFT_1145422 [Neolentinus lepideus HHB14362 ss-1]